MTCPQNNDMTESCNLIDKLERLSSALSTWGSLDDSLAALVAQILNAENCDVALLESDRLDKLSYHSFGTTSDRSRESEIDHESFFKHVIGSGRSLIVGIKDDYAGEVIKLQHILNSLFAQIALAQSVDKRLEDIVSMAPRPDQMARVVSKAFYLEMKRAGLDNSQIVVVASEIISELSKTLRKHSGRLQRDFPPSRIKIHADR